MRWIFLGWLAWSPWLYAQGFGSIGEFAVGESTQQCPLPATNIQLEGVQLVSYRLEWDAPTTNEDGTELTDLAGYIVYKGPDAQNLQLVGETANTQWQFNDLPGTYAFGVKAFDSEDPRNESVMSDILQQAIP